MVQVEYSTIQKEEKKNGKDCLTYGQIVFIAGQGDSARITERFCSDIFDHPVQGLCAVPLPLHGFVDHHVPDIVLGDIVIIDDHDISDHLSISIDAERLALVPVNICLRKAAYRVRNIFILSLRKPEVKSVQKIIFCDCLQFCQTFSPYNFRLINPAEFPVHHVSSV